MLSTWLGFFVPAWTGATLFCVVLVEPLRDRAMRLISLLGATSATTFMQPLAGTEVQTRHLPFMRTLVLGCFVLAMLAVLAVGRSHRGTQLDGFTIDEPWHIVAGLEYLRSGDFRLNPEHPPPIKLVAAAAIPDSFRMPPPAQLTEKAQERDHVETFMFLDNRGLDYQNRVRLSGLTPAGVRPAAVSDALGCRLASRAGGGIGRALATAWVNRANSGRQQLR